MVFQERDIEILRWINGFGFASADQVMRFIGVGKSVAYSRLKKLVDGGYIRRERVLYEQGGVYRLTKKGVIVSGDGVPPLKYINLGTFRHDYRLINLSMKLEKETGGNFISERRIRHDEGLSGVGQPGHIPDGYLKIKGEDKPIAIELELSLKSRIRIERIIHQYGSNLDIKEVWYFTDQESVARAIGNAAKGFSFIKTHKLSKDKAKLVA